MNFFFLFFIGSVSEDRESIISLNQNREVNPEPLSNTPSPYLSREFYLECLKATVERVNKIFINNAPYKKNINYYTKLNINRINTKYILIFFIA